MGEVGKTLMHQSDQLGNNNRFDLKSSVHYQLGPNQLMSRDLLLNKNKLDPRDSYPQQQQRDRSYSNSTKHQNQSQSFNDDVHQQQMRAAGLSVIETEKLRD